jgi:acetone carboxylase gamma subunit
MIIHKCLEIDQSSDVICCRECGKELCDTDENYKRHTVMQVDSVEDAGPLFEPPSDVIGGDVDFEFRQFFCPNCAVLFDYEFAQADDPVLHDIQLDI